MSKKIKILPEHISNMIAAGEVVERPASVVKELVENSIDAGADRIEISCVKSGKGLIRVIDNGCGMEYEDALTCLERHATSKIERAEDLYTIRTLGFRGEALPSIASVSDLILTTKTSSAQTATRIIVNAGIIKNVTQVGSPIGTIIDVKNLFSNLPVRAKFLRSDLTELTHIVQTIIHKAMPKPEISFIFLHNDKPHLQLIKTSDIKQRIAQIIGDEVMSNMIEVKGEDEDIKIYGLISDLRALRSNPLGQYLYVNNRYIRNQIIQKAIHEAYHPLLPRQKYPLFAIFIEIDPSRADFNVHPTKLEVRFEEPSKVVETINTAVKHSLNRPHIFPGFSQKNLSEMEKPIQSFDKSIMFNHKHRGSTSLSQRTRQIPLLKERSEIVYEPAMRLEDNIIGAEMSGFENVKTPIHNELIPCGPYFQIDNTYILYESRDGIVMIDQHAAHERINYEKIKTSMLLAETPSQNLITQPLLTVNHEEETLMESILPILENIGFSLEPFGERAYILRSVPIFLNIDPLPVLQSIIHDLLEHTPLREKEQLIDPIAATIACHISIKAHQQLKAEEIKQLIDDLLATQNFISCPHGRPTLFHISLKEIEKNFGR